MTALLFDDPYRELPFTELEKGHHAFGAYLLKRQEVEALQSEAAQIEARRTQRAELLAALREAQRVIEASLSISQDGPTAQLSISAPVPSVVSSPAEPDQLVRSPGKAVLAGQSIPTLPAPVEFDLEYQPGRPLEIENTVGEAMRFWIVNFNPASGPVSDPTLPLKVVMLALADEEQETDAVQFLAPTAEAQKAIRWTADQEQSPILAAPGLVVRVELASVTLEALVLDCAFDLKGYFTKLALHVTVQIKTSTLAAEAEPDLVHPAQTSVPVAPQDAAAITAIEPRDLHPDGLAALFPTSHSDRDVAQPVSEPESAEELGEKDFTL